MDPDTPSFQLRQKEPTTPVVTKGQRPHLETVALPLTGAGGLDSPRACFRRFVFVLTTTRWRETRARCPASVASVRDFRWPQPTAVTTRTPHPSAPQGTAHSEYLLGTLGHPPTHAERAGTGFTVGTWEHARPPGGLTRTGRGDAAAPFPCPPQPTGLLWKPCVACCSPEAGGSGGMPTVDMIREQAAREPPPRSVGSGLRL